MPSNPLKHPVRHQRSTLGVGWKPDDHAAFVGPGTKWANPFKKPDVEALRSEPDIERAYQQGGWREAANLLYREHLQDEGLDPRELCGKDLVCTCKLTDPCHVDVLLDLANPTNAKTRLRRTNPGGRH
jgi:uncharacterized protein DUF4326